MLYKYVVLNPAHTTQCLNVWVDFIHFTHITSFSIPKYNRNQYQKQHITTLLVDLFDCIIWLCISMPHLRSTPPSREALRHSGGDRRLWTSATVTLYLEVELSRERRPGTEQNTSVGFDTIPNRDSLWKGTPIGLPLGWVTGPAQERWGNVHQ